MRRLEEVVGIYEEVDKMTETILRGNRDNIDLQKAVSLCNISQSLKNIDITLAILLDEKGGANDREI